MQSDLGGRGLMLQDAVPHMFRPLYAGGDGAARRPG